MAQRRIWETAGFFTIAAALHVSAAALMLPDSAQEGAALPGPVGELSAGGAEIQAIVAEWEQGPEISATTDMVPPEDMAEPQQPEPVIDEAPVMAALTPPPMMTASEAAPTRPNLPEPPEPQPEVVEPILPELQSFTPPEIEADPALTLEASARPQQRPEPQPKAEPEPKREAKEGAPKGAAKPKATRQGAVGDTPRAGAAAPQGQGGSAPAGSAGGGGGGVSKQQRASLMSQWGGQIRSCISRRASAPRGVREGGRVTLNLSVSRSGSIQGVGIAGSSGNGALDEAAVRAAQRAGRCPRAPAQLTDASYSFQLPINLQVR
jgi:protein TonB